jgi:hypothetical protein
MRPDPFVRMLNNQMKADRKPPEPPSNDEHSTSEHHHPEPHGSYSPIHPVHAQPAELAEERCAVSDPPSYYPPGQGNRI